MRTSRLTSVLACIAMALAAVATAPGDAKPGGDTPAPRSDVVKEWVFDKGTHGWRSPETEGSIFRGDAIVIPPPNRGGRRSLESDPAAPWGLAAGPRQCLYLEGSGFGQTPANDPPILAWRCEDGSFSQGIRGLIVRTGDSGPQFCLFFPPWGGTVSGARVELTGRGDRRIRRIVVEAQPPGFVLEWMFARFWHDPRHAFDDAWQVFRHLMDQGNLEAATDLMQVVGFHAVRCRYGAVVDAMGEALEARARPANWEVLALACTERAHFARALLYENRYDGRENRAARLRFIHFADLAEAAYARLGRPESRFLVLQSELAAARAQGDQLDAESVAWRRQNIPPYYQPLVEAMEQAAGDGRDGVALAAMGALLAAIVNDRDAYVRNAIKEFKDAQEAHRTEWLVDPENARKRQPPMLLAQPTPPELWSALPCVARLLWLRGADQMLPALLSLFHVRSLEFLRPDQRQGIDEVDRVLKPDRGALDEVYAGLVDAWDGSPGGRATPGARIGMAMGQLAGGWRDDRQTPPPSMRMEIYKRGQFRDATTWNRADMAQTDDVERWLRAATRPPRDLRKAAEACDLVLPWSPPMQRQALVRLTLEASAQAGADADVLALCDQLRAVVRRAPSEVESSVWAAQTAVQAQAAIGDFPLPEQRALLAREASQLVAVSLLIPAEALVAEARSAAAEEAPADRAAPGKRGAEPGKPLSPAVRERYEAAALALAQLIANTRGERTTPYLQAMVLLTECYTRLGRQQEAAAHLAAAVNLTAGLPLLPAERLDALMALAELAPDYQRRKFLLDQAWNAAGEAGMGFFQPNIADKIATAAAKESDWETQCLALLEVVRAKEERRQQLALDPVRRRGWFESEVSDYRRLAAVAARLGKALLALDCAEHVRARALLDEMTWRKVDMGIYLPWGLQQRLRQLEELRGRVVAAIYQPGAVAPGRPREGEADTATVAAARGAELPLRGTGLLLPSGRNEVDPTPAREGRDAHYLRRLLDHVTAEEAALESAVREVVPAYGLAARVEIPSASALAGAVVERPGLALLEYTQTDEGVVVVAISAGRDPDVRLIPVSPDRLLDNVQRFRAALRNSKEDPTAKARAMYDLLVAPVAPVLARTTELLVVADGSLHLLPFGALKDKGGRYLAERFAISYAPSLALRAWDRGDPPRPERKLSALVFAAPETRAPKPAADADSELALSMLGGISSQLSDMAGTPLPGAKTEGEAVARKLGTVAIEGKFATKERLFGEAGDCDVLHVATHGFADDLDPDLSGLLLAGDESRPFNVLTAREVYLGRIRARLVTLSACETGLGKTVQGEGVLGLPRAFICAGARDVVCSLWPVSDESTGVLMEHFYTAWIGGATPGEAMQKAQGELLKEKGTRHPYYWAAFIPVCGPR